MNIKKLFFIPDPKEAKDFYLYICKSGILQIRILYLMGTMLLIGFGILDLWLLPSSLYTIWTIRLAAALVVAFSLYLSYKPDYPHWHNSVMTLSLLVSGYGILLMVFLSNPNDLGSKTYPLGLNMVTLANYSGIRIPFSRATGVGFSIFTGYVLLALFGQNALSTNESAIFFINNLFFILGVNILGIFSNYYQEKIFYENYINQNKLIEEYAYSERLLHAILPVPIATRLKKGEKVIADEYQDSVILFADLVNFSKISKSMDPKDLVTMLNNIFKAFDKLAQKYEIEKIKTIGDCYMAVAGAPFQTVEHTKKLLDFSIEIRKFLEESPYYNGMLLSLRIGIHKGKIVGGVIGENKFIFDIWGDAVNIASRMESHGIPGQIHVSEVIYDEMKDSYLFTPRGEIEIKGMGIMKTYILVDKISF